MHTNHSAITILLPITTHSRAQQIKQCILYVPKCHVSTPYFTLPSINRIRQMPLLSKITAELSQNFLLWKRKMPTRTTRLYAMLTLLMPDAAPAAEQHSWIKHEICWSWMENSSYVLQNGDQISTEATSSPLKFVDLEHIDKMRIASLRLTFLNIRNISEIDLFLSSPCLAVCSANPVWFHWNYCPSWCPT